jgi:hypothetical protein
MVINPYCDPDRARRLNMLVPKLEIPPLFRDDAQILEHNSRDYPSRVRKCNVNGHALAAWLSTSDVVERVYYPGLVTHRKMDEPLQSPKDAGDPLYISLMRKRKHSHLNAFPSNPENSLDVEPGFGHLFSFVLKPDIDVEVGELD